MARRTRLHLLVHLAGLAGALEITALLYGPRPEDPAEDPLVWVLYVLPILGLTLLGGWRSGLAMVALSLLLLSPQFIPAIGQYGLSISTVPHFSVVSLFIALPTLADKLKGQYRRQVRLNDTVTRLTRLIEERLDLQSLLTAILSETVGRCQAQYGVAYLRDATSGEFELSQTYGFKASNSPDPAKSRLVEPPMKEWMSHAVNPIYASDEASLPCVFLCDSEGRGEERLNSILSMPLMGSTGYFGVIALLNPRVDESTQDGLRFLKSVASMSEAAIEQAWKYEEVSRAFARTDESLARKVTELGSLEELARQLNATRDRGTILDLVLAQCLRLSHAWAGAIISDLDQSPRVSFKEAQLDCQESAGFLDAARTFLNLVIGTGQPVSVSFSSGAIEPDSTAANVSRLCLPIVRSSRPIGAIYLESILKRDFDQSDVKFLSHLAEHAAIALENARLFARLEEDRQRTAQILESIADGVFTADREGRIVTFNAAAERITGWREQEVVGRSACELIHEREVDRRDHGCPLDKSMEQRMVVLGGPAHWRTNGADELQIAFSVAPLDDSDGDPLGTVTVFRDITAHAKIDRLKSDFISMVSHELRSPLASISTAAEMLALETACTRSSKLLDVIRIEAQRLGNFIDDIIEVSRLDIGNIVLRLGPVPLVAVLKQAIAVAEATTQVHTFTLSEDGSSYLVNADEPKVRMVIGNLLRNAVNYSPEGGEIVVSVREQNGQSIVSVTDHGIGIRCDQLDRVFERFNRLDNSDSKVVYGHGLGLYIAKGLVERQGGQMWVESEFGHGSTFLFTLPLFAPDIDHLDGDLLEFLDRAARAG